MKNRKRESCTSGTVRDEDGNILIYSARNADHPRALAAGVRKAPRHEIAVGGALAVPRALWGIERGVGLKENDAKRSSRWLWPKAWVSLQD
jgi:hypothetical protein